MKQNYLMKSLLLLLLTVVGVSVSWAAPGDATAIPLTVGNYLTTSTAVPSGTINTNDGGNLGGINKDATATFTLTNETAQDMVLCFLTGNNNNSSPQVTVTLNDGSSDFFTRTVDIENTGAWTPITMHSFDVGTVPAGTITLTFSFTNTGSYVCNLGSIGLYNKSTYISSLDALPGDVTLSKGKYEGGARYNYNNNVKVGWLSNNTYTYYPSLYASSAGTATLNIGMTYNGDGTMNVKITDASTGNVEVNKDLTITSDKCQGLTTPTAFELGDITSGFKTMKLTMSTSASYLIDYQDLNISLESFKDIAIDLRSGQLGTSGSNLQKYLTIDGETYNYADSEPESYNALLSASSYNGGQHGYVGLTADIPVKAGVYKLTVGTCQYNNGALAINNSSNIAQTIYDENGQTHTSLSALGTCDNSTVGSQLYNTSIWYQAENDETIKVVFDTYTPYFSFEKVDAVPDLVYVVTYVNDTEGTLGTVPTPKLVNAGESMTIPDNRTLYKEGYTLTGWNDGTTPHAIGSSFTPAGNTTLTAVFTANTYNVNQSLTDLTIRWDFQRMNGAPYVGWENRTGDFLIAQASVNGESIDVKLDINTNPGKFNNTSWTDWCQVIEGTTFTFPSKNGTTVAAFSMNEPKNGSDVKSTLDGNEYSSYSSNVATYSTTNTSGSSTLTVKGGDYYRYIDVTIPADNDNLLVKAITVDGVALGGDILAPINFNNPHTATFSDNIYTAEPTVVATLKDDTQVTATVSGTGTSRTYTVEATIDETAYTFTLNVDGIYVYSAGANDETVQLKYTGDGNDKTNNIWSNGLYSLSPVGDGWNNSGFKLSAANNPFTLSVPGDVKVKQFIIRDFIDNYAVGSFNTITSTGMTAYVPTNCDFGYSQNGGGGAAKYDLVINLEDHTAGTPIVFSFTGGSQITGWYELTIEKQNPGTAPVKTGEKVTVVNNHVVVAVSFDREVTSTTATINGSSVTAEGGSSTLYFPVWNLNYSTNYSLNIAAGAVTDTYGNSTAAAIEVAVNIPAKAAVTAATYDYVVSNVSELTAALDAVEATNGSTNAARKTIFLKNGDYDLGTAASDQSVRWVRAHNLSLIGESRDGVIIHGTSDGISNPVLNLRYWQGYYLQDITVRNDKNYGLENKDGVAVAIYGGDKTIMKNVRMLSNQDTQVTGHRAYFEDCAIHGTVDFICGGGDNFYWHTDLVLEDRGGNCITAPSTNSSHKWGYVFQECTIKGVDAAAATTNADSYNLGRPWQNEPRCYYLNTTMNVLPATGGWGGMSNLPTHFYEYNSMDANGTALDLSGRTNSPTSTNSYTPVLSADDATKFTVENVLGGTDSWLPTDYTAQTAATTLSIDGTTLSWTDVTDARCYVIFKDGEYLADQTETSYTVTDAGIYTVRAANEMGGLGTVSNRVIYADVIVDENSSYTPVDATDVDVVLIRTIKANAWNTIVLPFAMTEAQIEAAFGDDAQVAQLTSFSGNTLHFTTVTAMNANEPYMIKLGTAFSNATINDVTIEEGTPSKTNVDGIDFVGTYAAKINIPYSDESNTYYFISSNMLYSTASSGTPNTMKGTRAYFKIPVTTGSAKAISYDFDNSGETTGISNLNDNLNQHPTPDTQRYNLSGQRVGENYKGIVIMNSKKYVVK